QHIAGELVGRFEKERPPLPAISLASDTSVMTCIANDYEYESLFARQVEALARPGDLLWALSTSGESPNILRAAEWAKENGITVISFTGCNESTLENISDHCLCVGTRNTARVQEIHQLAYHIICRYLDNVHSVSP
ncbi:MAG: SIS domain-containing protein, partial [Balneolaceae bacterium]|nr:SIS domain-containing protein [Balneolaceae bacterium]